MACSERQKYITIPGIVIFTIQVCGMLNQKMQLLFWFNRFRSVILNVVWWTSPPVVHLEFLVVCREFHKSLITCF